MITAVQYTKNDLRRKQFTRKSIMHVIQSRRILGTWEKQFAGLESALH